jgi:hypothetical protein
MNQPVSYPQYRKFPTNAAYFKIHSATQWEEIQVIGKKYILNYFTVKILPDRNYIHDLTFEYENNWVKIEEEEYEGVKERCKN